MLRAKKLATMTDKELRDENKGNLDAALGKSEDQQESVNVWSKFANYQLSTLSSHRLSNTTNFAAKSLENNFSAKDCRRKLSFMEVTG
ncbi:hypothetical protein EAI_03010 [Harpegnathos saltator]|uniref:Uncharacterized protein n=1 Tax=Harpegnathos saltator TaxID=610380 RepID=E2BAH4_HARSA|nr:hypothetical protein EAI_03010 [Harpegnathos saltator]